LASIERAGGLPDAFTVRVDFRKPVLLPARVQFGQRRSGSGSGSGGTVDFALYDEQQTLTHLIGQLQPR
ncbi:MAG: hypothetical protein QOG10_477, partial [Kribbellaceae bacterium]|nr:hypothetical protein [Kribbellaceae bacterium]